jgi:6-phosphogluconolactonase
MPAVKARIAAAFLALAGWTGLAFAQAAAPADSVRVYVGTYTDTDSRGIYRLRLDLATGALSTEGEPTPAGDPSWLTLSPDGARLFAVNETGQARTDPPGGVSAFAVDGVTGALTFLNRQPSGGAAPCYLSLDASGRHALVANYWGGNVSVFPVDADGRLGTASAFVQHALSASPADADAGPHAHSIDLDAANRYAIVADLGLDRVYSYRFDAAKGTLAEASILDLPTGAGPRHLTFHPDGRHAYLINELSSTVTALSYAAASGALEALQTISTLPDGFTGRNGTAEVAVSPDGRFLYGSNRGHDSLAIFAIDAATGRLSPIGHQPTLGKHPRHFAIDPTGAYLLVANRDSDNVVVFRIDRANGRLEAVGQPFHVPRAVCLQMRRVGRAR